MKSKQRSTALILVILLGATVYALVHTSSPASNSLVPTTTVPGASGPEFVDQRPLQTAQQFAKMSTSAEEKPFAEQALALGDHEMDLAFAAAVLDAREHPAVLSPEANAIQARFKRVKMHWILPRSASMR